MHLLNLTYWHDPLILLLAIAVGIGGTNQGLDILASAMAQARRHRGLRLAIASVVLGANIWCFDFLIKISFLGGHLEELDITTAMFAAIYAVASIFTALTLAADEDVLWKERLARGLFALSLIGTVLFNSMAFTPLEASPGAIIPTLILLSGLFYFAADYMLPEREIQFGPFSLYASTLILVPLLVSAHVAVLPFLPNHIMTDPNHSDLFDAALPVAVSVLFLGILGSSANKLDRSNQEDSIETYRQLALHDSLTGLPNRLNMQRTLDTWIDEHRKNDPAMAIATIDLDYFKDVNDVHGHEAGDALLAQMAKNMTALLEDDELIFRTGGDEFVALRRKVPSRAAAQRFAQKFCNAIARSEVTIVFGARISASIGCCLYPQDGTNTADLLSRTDLAMYRAKALGKSQVCMFDITMDEARRQKQVLSMELNRAIADDELEIYWQPQVDSSTGTLLGFEALLRWHHPQRGFVPPSEFIPLAEQTGKILDIGEWVLRNACIEAASWHRPCRISVNVAAGQVNQGNLPLLVQHILKETGLSPSRLELEITETGIIRDTDRAYEIVWNIKEMGVGLAMDDFGTGYSSLSTLKAFPFDKIKIDRSFIAEIAHSSSARAIVDATIRIAQAMGMRVLAEGIEEPEQVETLNRIGCYDMQGYFFSRPMPANELRDRFGLMDDTRTQFDADYAVEIVTFAHLRQG